MHENIYTHQSSQQILINIILIFNWDMKWNLIDEVAENLNRFLVDIFEVKNSHVGFEEVTRRHKSHAIFFHGRILWDLGVGGGGGGWRAIKKMD